MAKLHCSSIGWLGSLLAPALIAGCVGGNGLTERDFWGEAATEQNFIHRTIVVDEDTRRIRVKIDETIRFIIHGDDEDEDATFVWRFETHGRALSIPFDEIAPAGVDVAPDILVYVRPDPLIHSDRMFETDF